MEKWKTTVYRLSFSTFCIRILRSDFPWPTSSGLIIPRNGPPLRGRVVPRPLSRAAVLPPPPEVRAHVSGADGPLHRRRARARRLDPCGVGRRGAGGEAGGRRDAAPPPVDVARLHDDDGDRAGAGEAALPRRDGDVLSARLLRGREAVPRPSPPARLRGAGDGALAE